MKLKQLSTLCLAASGLMVTSSAMAWESEDGSFSTSANVAYTSDYMWRGYSQTENESAIQGGFDVAHSSGLYAGIWGSNIDYNDDASRETDIYVGFSGEAGGFSYDVGFLRYLYDGESYDWNEAYGSLSYSYFTLSLAHAGNTYTTGGSATYYNLGFDYELPKGVALSAGVGYYDYSRKAADGLWGVGSPDSAVDYRISLSKEYAGFGFDVSYTDTDSDGETIYGEDNADGRVFFTISKSM